VRHLVFGVSAYKRVLRFRYIVYFRNRSCQHKLKREKIEKLRKVWKDEFLTDIRIEITKQIKNDLLKVGEDISAIKKQVNEFESLLSLLSEKYDTILENCKKVSNMK